MLESLHIENIAVIEKADVDFSSGFTVLTGETGAGKSIIIDSINAVLGERTSKELIRTGCDTASVTACFSGVHKSAKDKLSEYGIDLESDEIIITRKLDLTKSSLKINGITTPAFVAKEIAPFLLNIHGQHDSQMLLNPDMHYVYIDLLAQNEALLQDYRESFSAMLKTRKAVKEFEKTVDAKTARKEILQYQINELESAGITVGEIEQLKQQKVLAQNTKKIADALNKATVLANGVSEEVDGAKELFMRVANSVMSVASYSKELETLADKLDSLSYEIESAFDEIESAKDNFDIDKNEIDNIEARLDMYASFSAKYGKTEGDMLDYLANAKVELEVLENEKLQSLSEQELLPKLVETVKKKGLALTKSREKAAKEFSQAVAGELEYLDMPSVKICAQITPCAYSSLGADKIEFLISTNPGEPLKPLAKIASGGEMSRIMLSIKNVLTKADIVPTLIFDEIDSGISGLAATKVANKLKSVSSGKQVICVTHLAQIAAKADVQLKIKKNIQNDRAVTSVIELDFDGRVNELARIIGSEITDSTKAAAKEMLRS